MSMSKAAQRRLGKRPHKKKSRHRNLLKWTRWAELQKKLEKRKEKGEAA